MNKGALGLPRGLGNLLGFEKVAETELTSSRTSLDLGPIPSDFTHLAVIASLRSDRASNDDVPFVRFNGDTGSNYHAERIVGIGAGVFSGASSGTTYPDCGSVIAANGVAGDFSPVVLLLPNYRSNTKSKAGMWLSYSLLPTFVSYVGITWRSFDPIALIQFGAVNADLSVGSSATVYGLP